MAQILSAFFSAGDLTSKYSGYAKMKTNEGETRSLNSDDVEYLRSLLKRYTADHSKAWVCLGWTLLYSSVALALVHRYGTWWSIVLFGCATVRSFIVFHDAGHLSFFKYGKWNNHLMNVMSIFVGYPPTDWARSHNHHHSE